MISQITPAWPSSPTSSVDSLFDDDDEHDDALGTDAAVDVNEYERRPGSGNADEPAEVMVASRSVPPIEGLYVFPELLPAEVASSALNAISESDHFHGGARDQVMLFTAPPPVPSSLPRHITELDRALADLITPYLPPEVVQLAFGQRLARQAILNLYRPGEGITPHVDLPGRYADGIVGVSLTGGCVLTLERVGAGMEQGEPSRYDVYLPPRTVYILSGPARWAWSHGIPGRTYDVVQESPGAVTLPRALRVSVTLRWMKEGGGVLT